MPPPHLAPQPRPPSPPPGLPERAALRRNTLSPTRRGDPEPHPCSGRAQSARPAPGRPRSRCGTPARRRRPPRPPSLHPLTARRATAYGAGPPPPIAAAAAADASRSLIPASPRLTPGTVSRTVTDAPAPPPCGGQGGGGGGVCVQNGGWVGWRRAGMEGGEGGGARWSRSRGIAGDRGPALGCGRMRGCVFGRWVDGQRPVSLAQDTSELGAAHLPIAQKYER